jgi:hypothetical protein
MGVDRRLAQAERRAGTQRGNDPLDPLAGSPVPVAVEQVLLELAGEPRLFTGRTPDGQRWLVVQTAEFADSRRWLCAPASERAIGCVASGRARPADVFRHSATGTVEQITLGPDGHFSESLRLCDTVSDLEASPA